MYERKDVAKVDVQLFVCVKSVWSKTAVNTTALQFCYAAVGGGGRYRAVL